MKTAPEFVAFGDTLCEGPSEWIFFDDFNSGLDNNASSGLGKWFFLETAGGATQTIDITANGGVLKLLQTTNDNDVISMQANSGVQTDSLKAGSPIVFGARFQTADADDVDWHIGLSIQDTSMAASAPADFVCFRIQEGTATLQLVVSKNSTLTTANLGTVYDATWIRAFFSYVPTATTDIGTLTYEVHTNGSVYQGTLASDGNWPDDVVIFPTIQVQNGSTDADASYVDWIYAKGTRAYTDGIG